MWHGRYFDVQRRTLYQEKCRDYRDLTFNTQDPLFFDHKGYELNGGIQRVVSHLEREQTMALSPYRCIYLMYNMTKAEYFNKPFFTKLDNILNTTMIDEKNGNFARYNFAALYSYYKFNIGRPENVAFFERQLKSMADGLHFFEIIELLDAISVSKLYPREHFRYQLDSYLVMAIIDSFEVEFENRLSWLVKLGESLFKCDIYKAEVWFLWLKRICEYDRIDNLDDYDKILHMMIKLHEDPKSAYFEKLNDRIETFRDQVRKNPNRLWKYDPEKGKYRTYEELLKSREDYDETYEMGRPRKAVKEIKVEEVKEKINEKEVANELFTSLIAEKVSIDEITMNLHREGFNPTLIEEITSGFIRRNLEETAEKMRKEGKFEEKKKEKKVKKKKAPPPLGGKPGDPKAKGADKGAGKKEKK